jgi:membrane protease YdiL (CAAX protease family)
MTAPAPPPPLDPVWDWHDLLIFAGLYLPSMGAALLLVKLLPWQPAGKAAPLLMAQFIGYAFWFGSLALLLKVRYQVNVPEALGWRMPRRGLVFCLFGGPLVALGVGILGLLLRTPDIANPFKELLADRTSLLLVGLFACTLGPICEEIAFRGFVQPVAVRSFGILAGIAGTSAAFALLHAPQYSWSWQHVVLLACAGLVFGFVRHGTDSTAAAAFMHGAYNLTFFVAYLAQAD